MSGCDIVLIHGAWAGPWVWDTTVGPLTDAGHRPLAVSLPGVGDTARSNGPVSLNDLTDSVVNQIADLTGPIVLVGHSGGGVVATQVAETICERVAGVVVVAGMLLPSGRSFGDICEDLELPPPVGISAFLEFESDGTVSTVPVEAGAAVFFHRAEASAAIAAARRLSPQQETARLISPSWTAERFGSLPRLYIEAKHDRSIPLAAQRFMQVRTPGTEVISLECDHAPQLSAGRELAVAILEYSTKIAGRVVTQ